MGLKSLALIIFLTAFFAEGVAWARSADMKKPCVDCHTMHNSQNGVVPEVSLVSRRAGGSGVPQDALLNTSCYGCHSDAITRLRVDTPVVLHFSQPTYGLTGTELNHTTLAGGDFYWVASGSGELKGHNINIPGVNQLGRYPPGNTTKWFDSNSPLTCAGTTGCHGLERTGDIAAMYQTHHAVEQTQPMDGSPLTESYRWLDGVAGYEDSDYELSVSSGDHNQYKGINRSGDTLETSSISALCARCHGSFHFGANDAGIWNGAGAFGDPWIRHPVDYAMPLTGEYANYGGTSNAYSVSTPLGFDPVPSTFIDKVTGSGDSIITCISCHRAHGSPYDYSLRWDYKNWPGGINSYNGCGDCHTAKN